MAAVAPPADQVAGLLHNLSLESQPKPKTILEMADANKKAPPAQNGTVDAKDAPNSYNMPNNFDSSACYIPNSYQHPTYYYGYDGSDWDAYARYMNTDGAAAAYGDSGSLMYHHGYGYASYGSYSPATSPVGHNNQLYGQQQYQYTSPYYSALAPTSGTYTPSSGTAAPQVEVPSVAPAQLPSSATTTYNNTPAVANGGGKAFNGSVTVKPDNQDSSFNSKQGRGNMPGGYQVSGYQDARFGSQSTLPWVDGRSTPLTKANSNPSSKSYTTRSNMRPTGLMHGMGNTHGYMNGLYPSKLYGQYGSDMRTRMTYGPSGYYALANGYGRYPVDSRYRNKGRSNSYFGYGHDSMDGLNELNRGPRAKSYKDEQGSTPISLPVKGQMMPCNGNPVDMKSKPAGVPDRDQYNCSEIPDTYSAAKFFIIKSYSEDDIHKSIKYNVWSSTPNGNKKLDAAYKESHEKAGGCPVFLLFSVNTSGQFTGLAEMVGSVDFEKNVEYWQQDKWSGSFPLKWHIVKDVPNSLLKHIILENNENKPVTNSRDTQEVKLEQGLQVLKIFKDHSSKTCILDDFGFYEGREKMIQDKKAKQQQYRRQVWDGKHFAEKNKDGQNDEQKPEVAHGSLKEAASPVLANCDVKYSETGFPAIGGDVTESVKTVFENKAVNCC